MKWISVLKPTLNRKVNKLRIVRWLVENGKLVDHYEGFIGDEINRFLNSSGAISVNFEGNIIEVYISLLEGGFIGEPEVSSDVIRGDIIGSDILYPSVILEPDFLGATITIQGWPQ